jgi:hypothetical protein
VPGRSYFKGRSVSELSWLKSSVYSVSALLIRDGNDPNEIVSVTRLTEVLPLGEHFYPACLVPLFWFIQLCATSIARLASLNPIKPSLKSALSKLKYETWGHTKRLLDQHAGASSRPRKERPELEEKRTILAGTGKWRT